MKRYIAIAVAVVLIFTLCLPFKQSAKADALTATMVAAATYAVGQSFGITFEAAGWTAIGAQNMMETEVNNYCGGNIAGYFGSEVIRVNAGRLALGQVCYNGVINFLRYLADKWSLSDLATTLGYMFGNDYLNIGESVDVPGMTGFYAVDEPSSAYHLIYWYGPNQWKSTGQGDVPANFELVDGPIYGVTRTGITATYLWQRGLNQKKQVRSLSFSTMKQATGLTYNTPLTATSTGDLIDATVLNPTQGWEGDIGETDPDTNLDDLMDDIFEGAADVNLDVDGEVIDVGPIPPEPTVVPIPTHAPVDNVIDGLNDLIEQQDTVIEGIDDIIEGTDAIEDAIEDVKDEVGEIAETIEEATEVIDPEVADDYKFDLRNLFPFCIPFDIVRILGLFDVSPVAPHVQLPFVIDSLNFSYTFDLDFSAFNSVAAIMRGLEFIVFAIGLAIVTSKVIRW